MCTLYGPPCGLEVVQLDGLVGVVPIHPDSELLELLGHVGVESECELLACGGELVDSEFLDVLLRVHSDVLLDLDLDGKSVHVESGLVTDVVTLHPPVSDEDVLDSLVHGGSEVDRSSGVGWSVDEVELLPVCPQFLCLLVGVLGFPVCLDVLLDFLGVVVCADLLYHRSSLFIQGYLSLVGGGLSRCP